jgi:hypothetical protein
MRIRFDFSNIHRTNTQEYAIRFLLGGIVTLASGLVAHEFGPVAEGLVLAFPAIFPASVTLVEKHETERKRSHGLYGVKRSRRCAALDAMGAALGSIGLVAFAAVGWRALPSFGAATVLCGATVAWLLVSLLAWRIRRAI